MRAPQKAVQGRTEPLYIECTLVGGPEEGIVYGFRKVPMRIVIERSIYDFQVSSEGRGTYIYAGKKES